MARSFLKRIRRQLPVHSPLTARSLAGAALQTLSPESPAAQLGRTLTRRFDADEVMLFASGTQALTAAIAAALEATGQDQPVALPGYTCYDVASAAVGADARIILYDLDPETLAPEWASLERALKAGARVVVLAPLYGFPFDWSIAERLAERHDAILIEDAAQGAGSNWAGDLSGSLGTISTLSFGRGKGWTGGSGGALLLRGQQSAIPKRPPGARRSAAVRVPAAALAQWLLARPSLYGVPRAIPWLHLGETRYRAPSAPEAMPRFSAALIGSTDELARAEFLARQATGLALARQLEEIDGVHAIRVPAEASPGFLRVPCRIPDPNARRRVLELGGALGIEPGYPTTLVELDAVRRRLIAPDLTASALSGARALAREAVTLPCHGKTRPDDRQRTLQCLREERSRPVDAARLGTL